VLLSGAFLLIGLLVGMYITTQWRSQSSNALAEVSAPITRQSDREMVEATISRLESEQARLKQRIADLRGQLNNEQSTDGSHDSAALSDNEVMQQRITAGMVAVQGPGVTITLDDSAALEIPENEDPANYILHEYDLRDVVNALWIAGAEAISVNGERIVSTTSLYCVGTTIICNATRLSPPYVIKAIGNPAALSTALRNSPQMEKLNQRARIYDLPLNIETSNEVRVLAYNGSFVFKYANAQDQK
jgi:uncharacterized protein YlxW (UPF0749 family)